MPVDRRGRPDAAAGRARARDIAGERFYEIYIDAPLALCRTRDPKGHYLRADQNEIADFTGVGASYEAPTAPDLRLDTAHTDVAAAVQDIERLLLGSAVFNSAGRTIEFTI